MSYLYVFSMLDAVKQALNEIFRGERYQNEIQPDDVSISYDSAGGIGVAIGPLTPNQAVERLRYAITCVDPFYKRSQGPEGMDQVPVSLHLPYVTADGFQLDVLFNFHSQTGPSDFCVIDYSHRIGSELGNVSDETDLVDGDYAREASGSGPTLDEMERALQVGGDDWSRIFFSDDNVDEIFARNGTEGGHGGPTAQYGHLSVVKPPRPPR